MEPLNDTRRKEVASLLAMGMDPAELSRATGISADHFPSILKDVKARAIKHRFAAKRGEDVRSVIVAAANHQKALMSDPWASVPDAIAGIVQPKVEIAPGLAGLDRRIVIAYSTRPGGLVDDALERVGVEDAWTSIDMLAGRYVVPAGAQANETWNMQVAWNRVSSFLDFSVERMVQILNPSSLLLLQGRMDWGLWRLRAEYVVKHEDIIDRFDWNRYRAIVESPRRDAVDGVRLAIDRDLASQLVRGMASVDRTLALEHHRQHAWGPFIGFDRAWREEWLDRLVLVLYNPPALASGSQNLHALATMFPVVTMYTGEGTVWAGGGKREARAAAILDCLVPRGNVSVMTEHVLAVASAVTSDITVMPECAPVDIVYPDGYPAKDVTRLYAPAGLRASAVQDGRLLSMAEHWAAQKALGIKDPMGGW